MGAVVAIVGAGGLAEMYALGRLHPVNRVGSLEERVERIARALVYVYRGHRRIRLDSPTGDEIAHSDQEGEYLFTSEGGTVTLSLGANEPLRTNQVNFEAAGCPNAVSEVCHNDGTVVQLVGCARLTVIGEDSTVPVRAFTLGDNTNKESDIRVEGDSIAGVLETTRYVPLRRPGGGFTFLLATDEIPLGWTPPSETYTDTCA